jgi:hypothetical protein
MFVANVILVIIRGGQECGLSSPQQRLRGGNMGRLCFSIADGHRLSQRVLYDG